MNEPAQPDKPKQPASTNMDQRRQNAPCTSWPRPGMKKLQTAAMTLPDGAGTGTLAMILKMPARARTMSRSA